MRRHLILVTPVVVLGLLSARGEAPPSADRSDRAQTGRAEDTAPAGDASVIEDLRWTFFFGDESMAVVEHGGVRRPVLCSSVEIPAADRAGWQLRRDARIISFDYIDAATKETVFVWIPYDEAACILPPGIRARIDGALASGYDATSAGDGP